MTADERVYRIALTQVPQIGPVHARLLLHTFKDAGTIFNTSRKHLERMDGIGSIRANAIKSFNQWERCHRELDLIEKNNIRLLFIESPDYPDTLRECADAPTLLYLKGKTTSLHNKCVSIVGTRQSSSYGRTICESLIHELAPYGVRIVSGLADGIDSIAHLAALKAGLDTVAVLGHGIDRVYPGNNIPLAKRIVEQGALITDFISGTKPDKPNFPARNRITAGISQALVVIETGEKGGSMITANYAFGYNRDVFTFPGNLYHKNSKGCHQLLRQRKAEIITSGKDLLESMGWTRDPPPTLNTQLSLFDSLSEEEALIYRMIREEPMLHRDILFARSASSYGALQQLLLSLEMKGVIDSLPGGRFRTKWT
jgi:DNA processing protein